MAVQDLWLGTGFQDYKRSSQNRQMLLFFQQEAFLELIGYWPWTSWHKMHITSHSSEEGGINLAIAVTRITDSGLCSLIKVFKYSHWNIFAVIKYHFFWSPAKFAIIIAREDRLIYSMYLFPRSIRITKKNWSCTRNVTCHFNYLTLNRVVDLISTRTSLQNGYRYLFSICFSTQSAVYRLIKPSLLVFPNTFTTMPGARFITVERQFLSYFSTVVIGFNFKCSITHDTKDSWDKHEMITSQLLILAVYYSALLKSTCRPKCITRKVKL